MCYSKYKDGAFWLCCILFGDHAKGGGGGGDLFVLPSLTGNFTDLINLHPTQTIKNFIFYHMSNILLSETLFVPHNRQPINIQLDKINQNQISNNRQIFSSIVKAVLFCARQNIALRGPKDNGDNFPNLLNLMENCGDNVLKEHFKNVPHNATYRSKTMAKDDNVCF